MKPIKCSVHYEYGDGVTIVIKPFKSINKAKQFCKVNGISATNIERKQ